MALLHARSSVLALGVFLCVAAARCGTPTSTLTIGTTTSVAHSGLLDHLTVAFAERTGVTVRAHLVGSGQALRMLERADVALVISHAPALESEYLARHPDWAYRKVMFNDFVIVGPAADPARVRGASNAAEAMRRIARHRAATFVSRGDHSGTHERELALWATSGATPERDRLIIAGQGMSGALRVAAQIDAHTLSDRATMMQLSASVPNLRILFEGDSALLNTYAVITPVTASLPARRFAEWLSDGDGRARIETFRVKGHAAFRVWPLDSPRSRPADLPQ